MGRLRTSLVHTGTKGGASRAQEEEEEANRQ